MANYFTVGFRQSKTALFDWTVFGWILLRHLLIVESVFIVFVLFLEAVGVREYCCVSVENRLEALCFVRSPRATRASRATNTRRSRLVALDLAESAKATESAKAIESAKGTESAKATETRPSCAWGSRCWKNDMDTASYCHRVTNAAGERSLECATLTCGEKQQQQ